jgi:hypothetical protein
VEDTEFAAAKNLAEFSKANRFHHYASDTSRGIGINFRTRIETEFAAENGIYFMKN